MKRIKRNPIRFDVFNAFAQFGREARIALTDPGSMDSFLDRIRLSVSNSMRNEAFLYGQHAQAMFEAMAISLGRVQMLKQEDCGEIYTVREDVKVPDVRLVLADGQQILVEVKNFYQSKDSEPLQFDGDYIRNLQNYAQMVACRLAIAVYWVKWRTWTLIPCQALKHGTGKVLISFPEALKRNQMATLGDMMVGTKFPLTIFISANKEEPRNVEEDGNVSFSIGDIEIQCAGHILRREEERNIAWYLIMHGKWEEERSEAVIQDGKLEGIKFEWKPFDYETRQNEYREQGFAIVGSLSQLFSSYYRAITEKDGRIGHFRVDLSPGSLGQLIPTNYESKDLPLWRIKQVSGSGND